MIGRAIETYAKRFGYGVVRDYTGHGVGRAFHSGLDHPPLRRAAVRRRHGVGMVFTIEPMLTLGGIEADIWADDWTVTTRDKSLTAQFEHTLVVTERGADILTLLRRDHSPMTHMQSASTSAAPESRAPSSTSTTGELVTDRIKSRRRRAASPTTSSRS